jgi:hypothetical protein
MRARVLHPTSAPQSGSHRLSACRFPSPHPVVALLFPSLLTGILSDLAKIGGSFQPPCVARCQERGPQARCRRSWLLPGHATILGHQLVRTGHSPLCYALSGRRRVKNVYCKRIFQVFYRYVESVLDRCCKSISGYCNGCAHILQAFVPNVSSVFSYGCYISHICCKCSI